MLHEKAGKRGTWNRGRYQVAQSVLTEQTLIYTEISGTMNSIHSLDWKGFLSMQHAAIQSNQTQFEC